jgi:hypothetical protein
MNFNQINIAKVISNKDDLKRERIFVRVVGVHDMNDDNSNNGIWLENGLSTPFTSGYIPEVDSFVYMQFFNERIDKGIYMGTVRHNLGE